MYFFFVLHPSYSVQRRHRHHSRIGNQTDTLSLSERTWGVSVCVCAGSRTVGSFHSKSITERRRL